MFIVKVEGESMWPELIAGKRYFATSLLKPKVGQYAVFKNPENTKQVFVKKVKNIQDGDYILCGTVPWSNEYLVGLQFILGRVIKWRD